MKRKRKKADQQEGNEQERKKEETKQKQEMHGEARRKNLLKMLDDLDLLYSDLNRIILEYEAWSFEGKYLFEWQGPKGDHIFWRVVHDDQYLYINCSQQREIYRYSLDGKLINSLKYYAIAMEIINNQLYLMDDSKFFLVDIKINSLIQSWNLPTENNESVGGWYLKVDQEKIYFTPCPSDIHYVYLFNKNGREIKKFGKKEESQKNGEFHQPYGLTVNEKYLYVCDQENHSNTLQSILLYLQKKINVFN